MDAIKYKVYRINLNLQNHFNCTYLAINNRPQLIPIVIVPAIKDVKLYDHLCQYVKRIHSFEEIEQEIESYLINNLIRYKISLRHGSDVSMFNNQLLSYLPSELINKGLSQRNLEVHCTLGIFISPPIEDVTLRSCVTNFLHDVRFIHAATQLNYGDVIEWIESVISSYQIHRY